MYNSRVKKKIIKTKIENRTRFVPALARATRSTTTSTKNKRKACFISYDFNLVKLQQPINTLEELANSNDVQLIVPIGSETAKNFIVSYNFFQS